MTMLTVTIPLDLMTVHVILDTLDLGNVALVNIEKFFSADSNLSLRTPFY